VTDLIACVWDGECFRPESGFMRRRASDRFGAGEVIMLSAEEERSMRSHRHYFAHIADLWRTLPERFAAETWAQSPEHFRRWLLIRAGYSNTQTFDCESKAEALRLAAAIRPLDEFSIVVARASLVLRFTAKSQSVKAMGRQDFQASKDATMALAETLVSGGDLPAIGVAA
jgi:hypothetical protein